MTLPDKPLAQTEQERITGNIELVDSRVLFVLQGFRDNAELARQLPLLGQLFVAGDVSTSQEEDERTEQEKEQQGQAVRNDITAAIQALKNQGVDIAAELRGVYAPFLATPPQKPTNTAQERVQALRAFIGLGKAAVMAQMLGMD